MSATVEIIDTEKVMCELHCLLLQLSHMPGRALVSLTPQPKCQLPFYVQIQFHHSQKVPVLEDFSKKKIKIKNMIPNSYRPG